MIAFLVDVAQLALLAAVAFYCALGWATFCEMIADSGCTCTRYTTRPTCPVHGWERS